MTNKIPTTEELQTIEFQSGTLTDFALFLVVRMSMMMNLDTALVWTIMLDEYNTHEKETGNWQVLEWSTKILEPEEIDG